tara:strand:- start:63 stop:164 length:102 start_codon:yes stop_codon:yes gene_type:complete
LISKPGGKGRDINFVVFEVRGGMEKFCSGKAYI